MRLLELRLNHFGKFHDKTVKLKEGINLIYGCNEAGKSTIHSFIKGMLFGIEKLRGRASKDDIYLKYQPWETPGAYSGSMDMDIDGKQYRILRNFDKNTRDFKILDIETGRELKLGTEELKDFYGGLTEAGYRNTISMEQLKIRTDQELADEVRNYITNLSLSKSNEVDVTKALSFLQDKRKEIEAQQITARLASLEEAIAEGIACESKIDRLTLQLKELELQNINLSKEKKITDENNGSYRGFTSLEAYKSYLGRFPVILEKYRSFNENRNQKRLLEEKQTALQNQLTELDKVWKENQQVKNKITELESIQSQILEAEEKKELLMKEAGVRIKEGKRKCYLYSFLPVLPGIAGGLILLVKHTFKVGLTTVLLSGILVYSILAYFYLMGQWKKKQEVFSREIKGYEEEILKLQNKTKDIYHLYKVQNELELRKKLEDFLRCEISLEHAIKQKREYQEQLKTVESKISLSQQEILDYINQSPDIEEWEKKELSSLNDTVIIRMEEVTNNKKHQIETEQQTIVKEQEDLRIQIEKLKWELNALSDNEEKLFHNKELQKELLKQREENERELAAIKLATETINGLSLDIHDSFGQKLNLLVSGLAEKVTAGRYSDIKVDEKLTVKVGYQDKFVLLDRLSAGTIEQLFLALRIGISDIIYGKGNMPVLLDDCFAMYDDDRVMAALHALTESTKGQIILFTCHKREKELMDQQNMKYHYINLSDLS